MPTPLCAAEPVMNGALLSEVWANAADDSSATEAALGVHRPVGLLLGGGGGGTLAALPMPLGSLIELLPPPTLPGPDGMPLTPVVPAPAEPALGVPMALPDPAPVPPGAPVF